jgi:hypothetical protein
MQLRLGLTHSFHKGLVKYSLCGCIFYVSLLNCPQSHTHFKLMYQCIQFHVLSGVTLMSKMLVTVLAKIEIQPYTQHTETLMMAFLC